MNLPRPPSNLKNSNTINKNTRVYKIPDQKNEVSSSRLCTHLIYSLHSVNEYKNFVLPFIRSY